MIYRLALRYVLKKHQDYLLKKPGGIQLDFSHTNLREMNFFKADFSGSIFTQSKFQRCDFSHSDLSDSDFTRCRMEHGKFHEANLSFAEFNRAILRKVRLDIHTSNVQDEELTSIKTQASSLWDIVDRLRDRALTHESTTLSSFLSSFKIRRPHDGKKSAAPRRTSHMSAHGAPYSDLQ